MNEPDEYKDSGGELICCTMSVIRGLTFVISLKNPFRFFPFFAAFSHQLLLCYSVRQEKKKEYEEKKKKSDKD